MKHSIYASIACLFLVACGGSSSTDTTTDTPQTKEALGELLFNDTSLSLTRNMSCATCHNPEQAFVDTRTNSVGKAVSVGDDGSSLGDRNSPTIGYANFTPDFDLDDLS